MEKHVVHASRSGGKRHKMQTSSRSERRGLLVRSDDFDYTDAVDARVDAKIMRRREKWTAAEFSCDYDYDEYDAPEGEESTFEQRVTKMREERESMRDAKARAAASPVTIDLLRDLEEFASLTDAAHVAPMTLRQLCYNAVSASDDVRRRFNECHSGVGLPAIPFIPYRKPAG